MIGLFIILILVLFLPFTVKKVEQNLEVFLFIMGIAAATVSGMMNMDLIGKALVDPINITLSRINRWFNYQMGTNSIGKSHPRDKQSSHTKNLSWINGHCFRTSFKYYYGHYCGNYSSDYCECITT